MGQIVGAKAKPKRANLNALSQVGTPALGEHVLVSSDNSMSADGQGNFDCYIVGDGTTAATALELKSIADGQFDSESYNAVSNKAFFKETENEINLHEYEVKRVFPGEKGRWSINYQNYRGIFIEVIAGEKYSITANASNASYYCCLKSITSSTTQGGTVDYATGFSGNGVKVNAGESATFTIPEDANYIYICTYTTVDIIPQKFAKLGKSMRFLSIDDVSQSLEENKEYPVSGPAVINGIFNALKKEVIVDLNDLEVQRICINSSTNTYVTWNQYTSAFISCEYCKFVTIKTNNNYGIIVCFVSEKGSVGNNVNYAKNGESKVKLQADEEKTIAVPSDATYIYVPVTDDSGNIVLPKSVILQGVFPSLTIQDVVDNLNSDDSEKALSAKQGKVLNNLFGVLHPLDYVLIFGLERGTISSPALTWTANNSYRSSFIKTMQGDEFLIIGNTSSTVYYAFTTKNKYENGESIVLVDSVLHAIEAKSVVSIVVPAGVSYLWVSAGSSAAQNIFKKNANYKERNYIYVAAYDATEWEKASADVVCSGVNDEVVLNRLLFALSWRGGGSIVLSSGTFFIDDFPVTDSNGNKVALYLPSLSNNNYSMIKIYGKWKNAIKNVDNYNCGTAIKVSTACYESLDENTQYKLFSAEVYTSLAHQYIELHDIIFTIPWNQKKIMMLDLLYIYGANLYDCTFRGYDNNTRPSDKWNVGVSTRPEAGVEGCIGIRLFRDSNAGSLNYFRQIGIAGFHTGWQLGGDHSILMQCSAIQNVYGFTVGEYDALGGYDTNHPITLIGFTYERNCNYPVFYGNGYGGHEDSQMVVNIYSMNIEPGRGNGGTPLPPDSEYHLMTETVPGNCRGIITYYMWQNRDGTAHLWGDGHGHGFHTTNIAHKKGGTTTLRTSYAPTYMQHYFDTDLNKEVICINPHAKTWVDAMGNQV